MLREPRHNRLCRGNRVLKSLGLKPYSTAGRLRQSDAEEFNSHSLVCSTESGYKSKNPDLSSMRTTTFLIGKLDVFLTEPGPARPDQARPLHLGVGCTALLRQLHGSFVMALALSAPAQMLFYIPAARETGEFGTRVSHDQSELRHWGEVHNKGNY